MKIKDVNTRLREIFESTIDSDLQYDDKIENMDYYSLFCKAASSDKLYKLYGNDVCAFNYDNNGNDSVMFLFFLPINSEDTGTKNIAERVMDVIKKVEQCFITLDYASSIEVKEDKFIYIVIVKNV